MSQCPACNGLISLTEICIHCGTPLNDVGSRDDYYGPYKPYMSDISAEQTCIHVLHCDNCGNDINWPIPMAR